MKKVLFLILVAISCIGAKGDNSNNQTDEISFEHKTYKNAYEYIKNDTANYKFLTDNFKNSIHIYVSDTTIRIYSSDENNIIERLLAVDSTHKIISKNDLKLINESLKKRESGFHSINISNISRLFKDGSRDLILYFDQLHERILYAELFYYEKREMFKGNFRVNDTSIKYCFLFDKEGNIVNVLSGKVIYG